jgi:hypothetical protein
VTFFIAGYFGVGLSRDPARTSELLLPIDKEIPFVPASIWVYLWIFPAALIPLFVVLCPRLFRRTALAYATAIAVSLICFAAFPVTSTRLRVPPTMLDIARPSDWAVFILYSFDPAGAARHPVRCTHRPQLGTAGDSAALTAGRDARPRPDVLQPGAGRRQVLQGGANDAR